MTKGIFMISKEELQNAIRNIAAPNRHLRAKALNTIMSAGEQSLEPLLTVVTHGKNEEQELAINYLWQLLSRKNLLDDATSRIILEAVKKTGNPYAQIQGLAFLRDILAKAPNHELQDEIIALLYYHNRTVRVTTLEFFGALVSLKTEAHLILLLDDEDREVAKVAERVLQKIATPTARFALHEWRKRK